MPKLALLTRVSNFCITLSSVVRLAWFLSRLDFRDLGYLPSVEKFASMPYAFLQTTLSDTATRVGNNLAPFVPSVQNFFYDFPF